MAFLSIRMGFIEIRRYFHSFTMKNIAVWCRPFSYNKKEPGSGVHGSQYYLYPCSAVQRVSLPDTNRMCKKDVWSPVRGIAPYTSPNILKMPVNQDHI